MRKISAVIAVGLLLAACAASGDGGSPPAASGPAASGPASPGQGAGASMVDPRKGGLEVTLGEWAVTLEAGAIRPGPVTFVVANRGTMGHGFEIELERDGDSSGSGSGDDDGIKAETNLLQPGESAELTLDLPAGTYKVECIVPGHDDLGMEGFLEVRENAPLVRVSDAGSGDAVSIRNFAFDPPRLRVLTGTEMTWTNEDTTPHTVTADDGSFDSGTLEPGQAFSFTVEGNGPVTYACQIHPEMTGELILG